MQRPCRVASNGTKGASTKFEFNYFVVARSETAMEYATNVDCHLIAMLGILAMCPFIYRLCFALPTLVDYDFFVLFLFFCLF